VAVLLCASAAQAQIYKAPLAGANENPPVASAGTGFTTVTVNVPAHTLRVVSSFSGLNTNTTASHIHCCAVAPATAGVATATPSFAGFPLGVTSGSMDQTYNMTLPATWNAAFITANGGTPAGAEAALVAGLAAGQAYLNIHTTSSPGGEIRGFLLVEVPTLPGWMLALFALLLAAAAYVALRKRVMA
jgi:hypothetical protein